MQVINRTTTIDIQVSPQHKQIHASHLAEGYSRCMKDDTECAKWSRPSVDYVHIFMWLR